MTNSIDPQNNLDPLHKENRATAADMARTPYFEASRLSEEQVIHLALNFLSTHLDVAAAWLSPKNPIKPFRFDRQRLDRSVALARITMLLRDMPIEQAAKISGEVAAYYANLTETVVPDVE